MKNLFFSFCLVLLQASVSAAIFVWDGEGSDGDWSTDANWDGDIEPTNDGTAEIELEGSLQTVQTISSAFNISSLKANVSDAAFQLSGSTLQIGAGGISKTGGSNSFLIGNAVQLTASQNWSGGPTVVGGVELGSSTLTIENNVTITGDITGTGPLVKERSGLSVLSGTNSFSGGSTVNEGTLVFGNSGAVPGAGSILISSGASAVTDYAMDQSFIDSVDGSSSGGAVLIAADSGNNLDLSSFVNAGLKVGAYSSGTLSGALTPNTTNGFRFGGGEGVLTVSSDLTGSHELNVSDGTLRLTGDNSGLAGEVSASGGSLLFFEDAVAIPTAPGAPGNSRNLTTDSGSAMGIDSGLNQSFIDRFNQASTEGSFIVDPNHSGPLSLAGFGSTVGLRAVEDVTVSSAITPNSSGYVFVGGSDPARDPARGVTMTVSSNLVDNGELRVSGIGLELTGNNTFTGQVTVGANGVLMVNSDGALGDSSNSIVLNSGNSLSISNSLLVATDSFSTNRSITLQGGANNSNVISAVDGETLTLGGQISGTTGIIFNGGNLQQNFSAEGTILLNNQNSYGETAVLGGTVRLGVDNALPAGERLQLNGNLDLNGMDQTVSYVSGGSTVGSNPQAEVSVTSGSELTLSGGDFETELYGTKIDGSGSIRVTGGTTDFTPFPTSTFSGTVEVTGGKLVGSGLIANPPVVSNDLDVVISGSGTINPGESPGTFSADTVTWGPGGTYQWEIADATGSAGSEWDLLDIDTLLEITANNSDPFQLELVTLAGSSAGSMVNFDELTAYSWIIAEAPSLSGSFVHVQIDTSGFQNTIDGSFSLSSDSQGVYLDYTPVPEPAALVLLTSIASLWIVGLRRRPRCDNSKKNDCA